jgi:hypothetical protein
MKTRAATLAVAIAIGGLLAGGEAVAAADAYGAALTRAIAAKERALDVNEPPRWEEALRLFQEAAALRATRECEYEIGFAAERLSRADLAVEGYEAALDLGLVGPPRARAEAFVAAHAAALGRLQVRGPAGTRLRVAGVDRGRLPLRRPLVLFPGDIQLETVDAAGHPSTVTVRLQSGHLELLDLATAVSVESSSDALASPEPTPPPPPRPSPLTAPAPQPAAPLAWIPPDAPQPVGTSSAAWPLMIGGAAVAIAAAVLLPVSRGQIDDDRAALAAECSVLPTGDVCEFAWNGQGAAAQSHEDGIATWKAVRLGAWIGLGVGLATVATGLVLKIREPRSMPPMPALLPDGAGRAMPALAWSLRF